ncbi:hypothetical protein P167DRAFT_72996 [Morchella conica CCBAS932]|uniref:C2H2-type domain-containing protein n=1 Tax=Morchella conica CCBAS932 TaxID=1392247 RepID=A0A3N4KU73_9PEZI|nr:hypothetical protein P167DRAFT_72996 [Morchella conica CCBAS932]
MEQRRYEITNEATGASLSSDVHGNIVTPGMRLSMAMVLRKRVTWQSQHECPRCGKWYEGATSRVLERVQCKICRITFQVSLEPRITEPEPEIDDVDTNMPLCGISAGDESIIKEPTAGATALDDGDIQFFRRLHVLLPEVHEKANQALSIEETVQTSLTALHSCEFCQKTFPRPCDRTKHRKTHERPFKCDVASCKYHTEGFPTIKEKERHQNDIHAFNSREWRCQFAPCTYKSKRESNCKQHMEKAHQYVYKRTKMNPRRRDHLL